MTTPNENKPVVRTPIFWVGWVLMVIAGGALGGFIGLEFTATDPSVHHYGWMAGAVAAIVMGELLTRAGRRRR